MLRRSPLRNRLVAGARWFSSGPPKHKTKEELQTYLHNANAEMQKYEQARQLMRQGKLKSANSGKRSQNTQVAQMGVVGVLLGLFLLSPLLGKKIAQDKEFRQKWIPAWFDFTVQEPEHAWTREELHEQMLEVQRELRERAIAGDFSPAKLEEIQKRTMHQQQPHRSDIDQSKIPKEWERIHPGVEDDESFED
jgi:hypothetical protein